MTRASRQLRASNWNDFPRPRIGLSATRRRSAGARWRSAILTASTWGTRRFWSAAASRAGEIGAVASVLTFDPTPQKVLRPESAPLRISTTEQRLHCFGALGIDAAVVLPFTLELAKLTPEEFVEKILVRDLHVRAVFVGENFRFGHKQSGDASVLSQLGAKRGFDVVVIPHVEYKGEVVSSTMIRREIAEGDVTHAARLLGRPFILSGKVVAGTGTGRRFTFPTLNLARGTGIAARARRVRDADAARRRIAHAPLGDQRWRAADFQWVGAEHRDACP